MEENEISLILNDLLDQIEIENDSSFEDPFELETKCDSCQAQVSSFWRRVARNKIVCNKCFLNKTYLITINSNNNETKKLTNDKSSLVNKNNKLKLVNNNNKRQQLTTQLSSSSSSSIQDEQNKTTNEQEETASATTIRKSSRFAKASTKQQQQQQQNQTKSKTKQSKSILEEEEEEIDSENDNASDNGSNRRSKFFKHKNKPIKNEPLPVGTLSTVVTSDFVFHRGFYMQIGDVVALYDQIDMNTIYFAQIRAFITDQYGHKSAVLTWLIPTDLDYLNRIKTSLDFDPNMFVQGPAEENARPLECMEFVCRLTDLHGKYKTDEMILQNLQHKNEMLRHNFKIQDINTNSSINK